MSVFQEVFFTYNTSADTVGSHLSEHVGTAECSYNRNVQIIEVLSKGLIYSALYICNTTIYIAIHNILCEGHNTI